MATTEKKRPDWLVVGLISLVIILLCVAVGGWYLRLRLETEQFTDDIVLHAGVTVYCDQKREARNMTVEDIDCGAWADSFIEQHPAIVDYCDMRYGEADEVVEFLQCLDNEGAGQYFP